MNMLIWSRLRIVLQVPIYAWCVLMSGCSMGGRVFSSPNPNTHSMTNTIAESTSNPMGMLSLVGGLAIAGGIVALVISRGSMGIRACICGLLCILINYMVCEYADWVFIPVIIGTGVVSLTYAYLIVRKALLKKRET